MDQGNDIKSPSMHRSDVMEKRMEMLAALLDRINEEGMSQSSHQTTIQEKKGGNKGKLMKVVAGIFFHRVR